MSDLRSDLTADLLTDLGRPAPPPPGPAPAVGLPRPSGTPAVTVRLTPLQWSRPALEPVDAGVGVAVRLGPWRVEVAV